MSQLALDFDFQKKVADFQLSARGSLIFSEGHWIHVLMGASGAGKTSLARWLAGLNTADAGFLKMDQHSWFDSSAQFSMKPQMRKVSLLSQNDVLFPHLTVKENIAYGLRKLSVIEREQRCEGMLSLMGLKNRADHKPSILSGGEKRRVALAQAMAVHPKLLILDEPFTGLDKEIKSRLWKETKEWIERFSIPTLLITHDEEEAAAFSLKVHRYENHQLFIKA